MFQTNGTGYLPTVCRYVIVKFVNSADALAASESIQSEIRLNKPIRENQMTMNLRLVRTFTMVACFIGATQSYAQQTLEIEYVRPGTDFSGYTGIFIHPMDLGHAKVVPPPWAEDRSPSVWALSPESVSVFQQRFGEVMAEEIEANSSYKVTSSSGPGVLEVDIKVTSVTPYVTRGEDVIKKGTGEISIQAELIDGATGDLLMVIAGDQEVGEEYKQNSIDTDLENIDELYSLWGQRLVQRLQQGPPTGD